MKITASPRRLVSLTMRSTCDACLTPSAAVGSSRISTRAPKCTARAMARDCRSPPDRPPTRRSPSSMRVMPKSCTALTAISLASLRSNLLNGPQPLVGSTPTKKLRPMLIKGNVPPNWWTVAIPRPAASRGPANATSWPSIRIFPRVGLWTPASVLMSVDLPAPLSPSRHSTSPAFTFSETSFNTSMGPKDLSTRCSSRTGIFSDIDSLVSLLGHITQRELAKTLIHGDGNK